MIKLLENGVYLIDGNKIVSETEATAQGLLVSKEAARENTITYSIMRAHDTSVDKQKMQIKFDSLASHDITYVGIIQTARASGLKEFPVPYAMTNCHNSLCAVGGTINEDDHVFGLSAAKRYGGIYVPVNQAVIHQYVREAMTVCGNMILGSDSHTRYGALGTMGFGEGGPEIVKQLLSNTYDVNAPEVVLVYLENAPKSGVGPHDVAIALCKAVFENGFVKNRVLEFTGPGVANLSMDFRIGIDVMTTETTCLSSIWSTDDKVKSYFAIHGRPQAYKELAPGKVAYYDRVVKIDLAKVESMIALPFHPSNAYTIHELQANPKDILHEVEEIAKKKFEGKVELNLVDKVVNGKIMTDQGLIAGCAGGMFDNICEAAAILGDSSTGNSYFALSVYPSSVPVNMALIRNGVQAKLMKAGAIFKPAFCGPCFGAGDVPANNGLSIRHTTRNFPNREGSKPGDGQLSGVALMDARSIAATAKMQGVLTAATDIEIPEYDSTYTFDRSIYEKRVYQGFGKPDSSVELRFGPNITDWPKMQQLAPNLLLKLASVIHDPVTTTDELIPSGETSSYRSNPLKMAEYTLSRRDPNYVRRAKATQALEKARIAGNVPQEIIDVLQQIGDAKSLVAKTQLGSAVFANRPGDGSAREQAASCQKVLGGFANICYDYATKRYRSNCINWGIVPFTIDKETKFDYDPNDYIFIPDIRVAIASGQEKIPAKVITKAGIKEITLYVKDLTKDEKSIILEGCLINYYATCNK